MKPALSFVADDATPEEIAAIVVVLSLNQTPADPIPVRVEDWPATNRFRRADQVRPRSWRSSSLPN